MEIVTDNIISKNQTVTVQYTVVKRIKLHIISSIGSRKIRQQQKTDSYGSNNKKTSVVTSTTTVKIRHHQSAK